MSQIYKSECKQHSCYVGFLVGLLIGLLVGAFLSIMPVWAETDLGERFIEVNEDQTSLIYYTKGFERFTWPEHVYRDIGYYTDDYEFYFKDPEVLFNLYFEDFSGEVHKLDCGWEER